MIAALLGLLVWSVALVATGRRWRDWQYAAEARRLNDAVTRGTLHLYGSLPDGRNADALPPDRYAKED